LNDLRKGAKVLETIWKKSPHPEIADLYVHARPGDSTHDRLARAKKLQSLKQNNPESNHAVARAALEAGELKVARSAAEALVRQEPRERAFLLMADIEEAETGEQGRVREWLARAVRAPRDAAWVADGYISDRWAPFSPVTGRIDAFEWRVPVEPVAQAIEPERRVALPQPAPKVEVAPQAAPVLDAEPLEPETAPVKPAAAPPVPPPAGPLKPDAPAADAGAAIVSERSKSPASTPVEAYP